MQALRASLLLAALALACESAGALTNGLDASFGTNGIVLIGPTPVSGIVMNRISALKVLDDGRIIIGGYAASNSHDLPAIGRLEADGSWDVSFGDHGVFALPYGSASAPYGGRIRSVDVFSDGRILATGGVYQFGSYYSTCTLLIKLTSTGAPDAGFAPDNSGSYCFDFAPPSGFSTWSNHSSSAKVDSDDTFFLTSIQTNMLSGAVAHLDAYGALVNAYATNGIAVLSGVRPGLVELLDGHRVLATGITGSVDSQGFGASRLLQGGEVDLSYGDDGVASADVQQNANVGFHYAARDAQDRLLLSNYAYIGGTFFAYRIARLTASGLGDTAFNASNQQEGSPGVAVITLTQNVDYDQILGAQPLPDGHIFAIGQNGPVKSGDGTYNISLLRLSEDAGWDTSFGDAAHPGWSSITIGGLPNSDARPLSMAVDPRNGRLVSGIGTSDSNGHGCIGLIRIVADRVSADAFDVEAPMPNCPQ